MADITITGGCGFVGGNLAVHFASRGHRVVAIDNFCRSGSRHNAERIAAHGVDILELDVSRAMPVVKGPVLHCAAQPSAIAGYDNPLHDFVSNTVATANVVDACRKSKAPLILWSTNKVYSATNINCLNRHFDGKRWNPPRDFRGFDESIPVGGGNQSIYGASKAAAEIWCQEYASAFGVPVVINRFSCLAGPHQYGKPEQGWVAWFAIAAELGLPVEFFGWGGGQVRDVLFVDDICRLIEIEIEMAMCGALTGASIFNVGGGMGNTLSLLEAIDLLNYQYDYSITPRIIPEERRADHCVYVSNIDRVSAATGWRPRVGIAEGYAQIVEWVARDAEALSLLNCLQGAA